MAWDEVTFEGVLAPSLRLALLLPKADPWLARSRLVARSAMVVYAVAAAALAARAHVPLGWGVTVLVLGTIPVYVLARLMLPVGLVVFGLRRRVARVPRLSSAARSAELVRCRIRIRVRAEGLSARLGKDETVLPWSDVLGLTTTPEGLSLSTPAGVLKIPGAAFASADHRLAFAVKVDEFRELERSGSRDGQRPAA
jgi:hypothetical protein